MNVQAALRDDSQWDVRQQQERVALDVQRAVSRVVLDNTWLAVKGVLSGRNRIETEAFEAFRGGYPFRAEFCARAKGWEKGSVECCVKYVRNLVFRPRLAVESWAALNAAIITELEADLPMRHLDDGRSAEEALTEERRHLRAMPAHLPATWRVVTRVADKFGHVRVDRVTYSVPIRHAYRPVWVRRYHDRMAIAAGAEVVAEHRRAFCRGATVLDALHVLPLLERKRRAVAEATALLDRRLAPVWQQAWAALAEHTRKPQQEWVRMLRLMETHPAATVERAVRAALERNSPRLETSAASPPAAGGGLAAGVPAGYRGASGAGADRGAPPRPDVCRRMTPWRRALADGHSSTSPESLFHFSEIRNLPPRPAVVRSQGDAHMRSRPTLRGCSRRWPWTGIWRLSWRERSRPGEPARGRCKPRAGDDGVRMAEAVRPQACLRWGTGPGTSSRSSAPGTRQKATWWPGWHRHHAEVRPPTERGPS